MNDSTLENFYSQWSDKPQSLIEHDINCGHHKASVITKAIPSNIKDKIKSILDLGCGYGAVLATTCTRLNPIKAIGLDYSKNAIQLAQNKFASAKIKFVQQKSLAIDECVQQIQTLDITPIDLVLLVDFLEHVPDPKLIIDKLAPLTRYFLIKLPIENTFLDNHILPFKEKPGPDHSNGHLREFTTQEVFQFVRDLGLEIIKEDVYIYKMSESFPPLQNPPFRRRIYHSLVKNFKRVCSWILPKKIFLRLVGGGGYYCLAKNKC